MKRPSVLFSLLATSTLVAVGAGCGGSAFVMAPDGSVPFATGQVWAESDSSFTVKARHLGSPTKLNPAAKTYVVWLQPRQGDSPIQNLGALDVDAEFNGSRTFNTTLKEFDVTVTPEERPDGVSALGPGRSQSDRLAVIIGWRSLGCPGFLD